MLPKAMKGMWFHNSLCWLNLQRILYFYFKEKVKCCPWVLAFGLSADKNLFALWTHPPECALWVTHCYLCQHRFSSTWQFVGVFEVCNKMCAYLASGSDTRALGSSVSQTYFWWEVLVAKLIFHCVSLNILSTYKYSNHKYYWVKFIPVRYTGIFIYQCVVS